MTKKDFALEVFRSFQTGKRTRKKTTKEQLSKPGDPQLLSELFSHIIEDREWENPLAEGNLFSSWEKVVGADISQHASPVSLIDGVLTLQTSSTAWATQLKLVAPAILETVQRSTPGVLVESLVFIGPQGPSWKKGLRSIRGAKGPRDTYG